MLSSSAVDASSNLARAERPCSKAQGRKLAGDSLVDVRVGQAFALQFGVAPCDEVVDVLVEAVEDLGEGAGRALGAQPQYVLQTPFRIA